MKLAIVIAILASLCLAGSAGAYVVNLVSTPNSGGTTLITNVADQAPTPYNNPAGFQTWFLLPTNQDWVSGDPGQLNSKMVSTTHQGSWTFAAFVESSVQNPTMDVIIYGANNSNISDLIGQRWCLTDKRTGQVLASSVWATDMTSKASPFLTYTFADTSGMVGPQNAVSLTFGPETPEPSSILALLTGMSGFGLIFRRRKN